MPTKLAVQFRKSRPTVTAFERLKTCRRCGSYTTLLDDGCRACGAQGKLETVAAYAARRGRPVPWLESLGVIVIAALAVMAAGDSLQLAAAVLGGAVLLAALLLLHRRYKPFADSRRLHRTLVKHTDAIREGLQSDMEDAAGDLEAGRPKEAYEKLREIGLLLHSERVKSLKIACLSRFYLRKDMELELEQVIPSSFSEPFVLYMWEAVKVNKQLVRDSVLEYVMTYRYHIEALKDGKAIVTAVASAALRMKRYVRKYPHLFVEYIDELPIERFQRLCRLVADTPEEQRTRLYRECRERAETRYAHDPDFQGIF